jgi:MarR family transcriptional regulator, organic hydroperoxide resistance regulator
MAKRNQHGRASGTKPHGRFSSVSSAPKQFVPPLTTTLKAFVKNGSDHEFRRLMFVLNSLFNQMKRHAEYFARFIGVSPAQFTFILIIAEMPNVTVRQIAEQMNVTSPFVTAEIGKLVNMGIVRKETNIRDRRSSFLKLASKGENLVRELAPVLCRANDLHFRSLTEETANLLKQVIRQIVADGRRLLHELESPDLRNATASSVASESATRSKSIGKE